LKTSILLDHEPVADGGFLVRALLRIEAEPPAAGDRVPLNLSLVLDRSGSMRGAPLAAARDAACLLVRRLRTEDTVSVVAYDSHVAIVANPATGEEQEHLPDYIAAIRPGGSTNLSGGWLAARDLVAAHRKDGAVNRILLLTDGLANVGITDQSTLVGLCRSAAAAGIGTTTLGFGPSYDEDLLEAMADAGGGGTYYIEHIEQAAEIFEEEIDGLLSIGAQNLRVGIRPGAHAESVHVVHSYPSRAEGEVLTVELGDLYAREPRRILTEVLLTSELEAGQEADVAEITVTAHVLTPEGGVELRTIALPITLSPEEGGRTDPVVRKEVLLLTATKAREEALRAQEAGDYERGAATLRDAVSYLAHAAPGDADLAEEIEDLRVMEGRFDRRWVEAGDIKRMKQRSYDSHRSRGKSRGRRSGERTGRTDEEA